MKSIIIKTTKWMMTLVVFASTLEVSARVDDLINCGVPLFEEYSSEVLRGADEQGIRHNIPGSRYEKWIINRYGFRGPEIPLEKAKNVKRVVCMGMSETFGLYESPGKEWPRQLGQILKGFGNYEVINSAVVGLPLHDFKIYLENYVIKIDPDLIILYINPFNYGVGTDIFEKRQDIGKRRKDKSDRVEIKDLIGTIRIKSKLSQFMKKMLPKHFLTIKRQFSLKSQINNLEEKRLNGKKPIDKLPEVRLMRFKQDMQRLNGYLRSKDLKIMLCTYPALISKGNLKKYAPIFLDHRRFYIELSYEGIIDTVSKCNEVIKKLALAYEIELVDVANIIPKTTEYFADNVHYTDRGAHIVAERIAAHLADIHL